MTYQEFLASKSTAPPVAGFGLQLFTAELSPFQRDMA